MASLQRAILMLRKLNLHGIPREIRDDLRQLQDAYSEELDLDGSDTSSQGSIELEPRGPEEHDLEEGKGETFGYGRREPGTKSQGGAEQRFTSGNRAQNDEEHTSNKDEGRTSNSEDTEYAEANLEEAFSRPMSTAHYNQATVYFGLGVGDPAQRATMQRSSFSGYCRINAYVDIATPLPSN
jgi:hypothetical protein